MTLWIAVGVIGSSAFALTGCRDEDPFAEAVEEVEDEAEDMKDEVRDEVDDHS